MLLTQTCSLPLSLRYMLGNGVKRKLDEDEDGVEPDKGLLSAGSVGGLSRVSYTLQRQTVLNISLMKLYSPRTPADPDLQRRVLINNMIRRIHDEFKEEGGLRALFFSVPPAAPSTAAQEDEGYHHQAPAPSYGGLSSPLSGLSALDSCLTPASLLEEDPPLFFTLPPSSPHPLHHSPRPPLPSPAPKDSFSSALEEIEDLCPTVVTVVEPSTAASPSLSSSLPSTPPTSPPQAAQALSADVSMKEEARALQEESSVEKPAEALPPPPPPPTTDTPSSPGAFLTDFALDDILFTDIDTSMYDYSPCTSPASTAVSKMAPVVMADDLVKTISSYSGAGGTSPNQPFKMDLAELDHIMEVLVGS